MSEPTNTYWIWCDLDGFGKRWRLAVDRGNELYFPVEDFTESGGIEDFRIDRPDYPIDPCRAPQRDPRVGFQVRPQGDRPSSTPWRLVATCSACYAEGWAWSEPGTHPDSGWRTLRDGLRANGWVVLEGDERPVVERPRHGRDTRQFCPECAAELAKAMEAP